MANMIRCNLGYSLKNIPIPPRNNYLKALISKTESFIKRLRWRVFWHENRGEPEEMHNVEKDTQNFGLKSTNTPPQNPALSSFENDIYKLISSIKFKNVQNEFQNKLSEDIKALKSQGKVIVEADKTSNLYQVTPTKYRQLLQQNVTKDYKHAQIEERDNVNRRTRELASKVKIDDKIERYTETPSFISFKDHKDNFYTDPKCRLINPAKSNLGKVSKSVLERVVSEIRNKTGLNQWKSTSEVITWFKELQNLKKARFLKFDIVEFYPSITPDLMNRALTYAQSITTITEEEKEIIRLSKESFLFNAGKCWTKKSNMNFDVTMGSLDGAETSELVGIYILNKIRQEISCDQIGLYRDDGLAIIEDSNGQKMDRIRKNLHNLFQKEGLRITVEIHQDSVNFLDTELFLKDMTYKPYKKPNDKPLYLNTKSNHPPTIIKNIPSMISKRLSNISSSEEKFNEAKHEYKNALESSGYTEQIAYKQSTTTTTKKKKARKRQVVWYNPPYSMNVSTELGRKFFALLDKHFPKDHRLHKLINRSTVKLSYSCMPNVGRILKGHNRSVLDTETDENVRHCSCRNKETCPLQGQCLTKCTVYQADVETSTGDSHTYIGQAEGDFKSRWNNHKKSFKTKKYENDTELSKLIWKLKDKKIQHDIKWKILSKCRSYKAGSRSCNLCLTEKLFILKNPNSINKRTELVSKCRHRRKFSIQFCT